MARISRRLTSLLTDRVLNIAIVVCALFAVSAWGWYLIPRVLAARSAPAPEPYLEGAQLPALSNEAIGDHDRAFVLFVLSSCPVCTDSMPFYREIVASQASGAKRIPLVVLSFDKQHTLDQYLKEHGLRPDTARSVTPEEFKFRATPRLYLVDRNRTILKRWQGRLSPEARAEVLQWARAS